MSINEKFLASVKRSDLNQVKSFLQQGADIKYRDAIMYAVENDNLDMTRYLLENGASLDIEEGHRYLLDETIRNGNLEMLKLLLKYGANPNDEFSDDDKDILGLAVEVENFPILKFLVESPITKLRDLQRSKNIGLFTTVDNDNLEFAEYLLQHGADIHWNNDVVLESAMEGENLDMIKFLIKHGANPDIINIKNILNPEIAAYLNSLKAPKKKLDFDQSLVSTERTTAKNNFYTVEELKDIARRHGLSDKGIKKDLVERILKL